MINIPPGLAKQCAEALCGLSLASNHGDTLSVKIIAFRVASQPKSIHTQLVRLVKAKIELPDIIGLDRGEAEQIELLPRQVKAKTEVSDADWLKGLPAKFLCTPSIIDSELRKAGDWIKRNPSRKLSRPFFENWMKRWMENNKAVQVNRPPVVAVAPKEIITRLSVPMPATHILKAYDKGCIIPRRFWPRHLEVLTMEELRAESEREQR